MKKNLVVFVLCLIVGSSFLAYGQMIKRTDAIWARTTSTPITLDGKLNETDWAKAESLYISYGKDNGIPGSGFTTDGWGVVPTDPLNNAVVKFLVNGDSLYVAISVKDSSIGGGGWPGPAKWEGVLSNMRNKSKVDRPVPNGEIYYAWNTEGWADPATGNVGAMPGYFGPVSGYNRWKDSSDGRLKAQIWDAQTFVDGLTNADSIIDKGYTMEFKINLKYYGYDPKGVNGDIIMYSIAIYDCDWQWYRGADTLKNRFAINKAWTQGPWGGNDGNHLRIFVKPSVTTTGAVPTVNADLTIPDAGTFAAPTIDGKLDEAVWNGKGIGKLLLRYGNDAIRNAYPNTAPFRSGQFQPDVNGGKAAIFDADTAIVKYFVKGDSLYLGFDVKDKYVQYSSNFDRQDGFRVMITARDKRNGDSVLVARNITFIIDSTGGDGRREDLAKVSGAWDSSGQAVTVKIALNTGTTVDTVGATADKGYTAEMKINLRKLGYSAGHGDGVLFFGLCRFDGDSDPNPTNSYGTRVWFMREQPGADGAAWMYMDPASLITSAGQENTVVPEEFKLLGNYPNPFNPSTTIKFTMPIKGDVILQVFDVLGRLVTTQNLGTRETGVQEVTFNASHLASGVYNYRLQNSAKQVVIGRMMLLK
ncbi:MAG: T9SS type A sorting domain-containing protein [Bacteroidota bacterium]|nr:T9SS type A sorting domain-containing protein [Bacteroidota bacterium]